MPEEQQKSTYGNLMTFDEYVETHLNPYWKLRFNRAPYDWPHEWPFPLPEGEIATRDIDGYWVRTVKLPDDWRNKCR